MTAARFRIADACISYSVGTSVGSAYGIDPTSCSGCPHCVAVLSFIHVYDLSCPFLIPHEMRFWLLMFLIDKEKQTSGICP